MGIINVIGGGLLSNLETLPFDKRNIQLTGKKHPKVLFIPTASEESESYIQHFKNIYGRKLKCQTDVLYLLNVKPTKKELRRKILSSDIIYVGGGNTLKMMKRWRYLGVDKILIEAYKKNKVLTGISAGGICWFEYGHSDSMSSYNPASWEYIKVKGLGLIKGIHCPHFNGQTLKIKRRKHFSNFMKKYANMGIAVDNHCAIEFIDDKYRVSHSKKGRKAYKVFKRNNQVILKEISQKKEFLPIKNLYSK